MVVAGRGNCLRPVFAERVDGLGGAWPAVGQKARGIRGAPDWVLEVISPASAAHDQIVKLEVYERAGVREYWLAHPADRVLTIYRLEGSSYGRPQIVELVGETPVGVLPGVTIRWQAVVERLLAG